MIRPRFFPHAIILMLSWGFIMTALAQGDVYFNSHYTYTRNELQRVIKRLEDQSDELVDDYKKFLRNERRWEPSGPHHRLLHDLESFENGLDRLEDRFHRVRDHRVLEPEVGEIVQRGFHIDQQLYRVRPNHEITEDWRQIRLGLQELAHAYAVDQRGRYGRSVASHKEIKKAIAAIENISDEINDDFKKFLRRDGRYRRDRAILELERELKAFENAADDLEDHFNRARDPRAVESEVRSLLARGQHIDHLMRRTTVSGEVRHDWAQIRAHLDFLADAYGLRRHHWR